MTHFKDKFNVFYSFWLYDIFSTCLWGRLVSWKWAGSVSNLTFDNVIRHPGKCDRFSFFVNVWYNRNIKLSISWADWPCTRVDPLNELTTHIIKIKKLGYQTNLAPGSTCLIKSFPQIPAFSSCAKDSNLYKDVYDWTKPIKTS